jgi:DNA-binding NarL/FixJ family response regulator
MPVPITVLIADDHETLREGLTILLEFETDLRVVAVANDGREAVELAKEHRPDVIVMDITMPHMNGLEATRQIRAALPGTNVLIVSAEGDDTGVEQAIACGALGFICKHTSLMNVPNAIREIHEGNVFFAMTPQPSDAGANEDVPVERAQS